MYFISTLQEEICFEKDYPLTNWPFMKSDQIIDMKRKSLREEFREQLDLYLFYRRYQSMLEGRIPLSEQIWISFIRIVFRTRLYWRAVFKRTLDLTMASLGLLSSAPLMILVALTVKLDSSGPVLFRQVRVGKKGKTFTMFKFRTMRQDAEHKTGPVWAQKNDGRVTRIGGFLRATHLDELPQLFNVLKGDMSLVGPRPERPYFVSEFKKVVPNYEKRLLVKPGITGLAQVRQRYDETIEDVKRKVRYDILYIQKMCPFVDLKILTMTLGSVISKSGR